MRIKNLTVVGLMVLAVSSVLMAQASRPDFSGAWNLDNKRSVLGERGDGMAALSMVIEHKHPLLTIKQKFDFQGEELVIVSKCTADGKPSITEGLRPGAMLKGITIKMEGNYLNSVSTWMTPQGVQKISETFSLSSDGKMLTIESSSKGNLSAGSKLVYIKK